MWKAMAQGPYAHFRTEQPVVMSHYHLIHSMVTVCSWKVAHAKVPSWCNHDRRTEMALPIPQSAKYQDSERKRRWMNGRMRGKEEGGNHDHEMMMMPNLALLLRALDAVKTFLSRSSFFQSRICPEFERTVLFAHLPHSPFNLHFPLTHGARSITSLLLILCKDRIEGVHTRSHHFRTITRTRLNFFRISKSHLTVAV